MSRSPEDKRDKAKENNKSRAKEDKKNQILPTPPRLTIESGDDTLVEEVEDTFETKSKTESGDEMNGKKPVIPFFLTYSEMGTSSLRILTYFIPSLQS